MWTRRQFVSRGLVGLLGAGGVCLAMPGDNPAAGDAQDALPDGSLSKDMINPRTDQVIDRGLAFLAAGARRSPNGARAFGTGPAYSNNVAITSLAALAFMAAGNQPNRGPYGKIVLEALRFVLSQENRSRSHRGFLYNPDGNSHGPMYSHGFGTLFLAEVTGMVQDPVLRDEVDRKLRDAVKVILGSQNPEGGWRYEPDGREADISVTICQIMALRAARNAGITVPKEKVDKCVQYVMDCQDRRGGYFRYQKIGGGGGGSEAFARTAAGVVALYSAGYYLNTDLTQIKEPDEHRRAADAVAGIKAGLDFMLRNRPVNGGMFPRMGGLDLHYFYGHYYGMQAMWAAGGDYWKQWYPAVREELTGRQNADGSWFDGICYHYATAMACICLQVPNNYLPILQR